MKSEAKIKCGLEILKASAGSGKTHTLTREYIRILLSVIKNADTKIEKYQAHRHILAVTFTNKATDEMKSRIVAELYTLSTDTSSSKYLNDLMESCGFESEMELKYISSFALEAILNDYGSFSVCTIDRFFQQTLKAFSREIGQISDYKVELDRDSLVNEAVDRLLDSLDEDKDHLLKWLSDSSLQRIESGDGYHLESNLSGFAKQCLSNKYKDKLNRFLIDEDKACSEENLKRLTLACQNIRKKFEQSLLDESKALNGVISSYREEYFNKNLIKKVRALASQGAKDQHNLTVQRPGYWTNVVDSGLVALGRKQLNESEKESIRKAVEKVDAFFGEPCRIYKTVKLIESQIYVFRVASALRKTFNDLLLEKNVLSLDDTNSILRDIIGHTDTPFIYEKTGTRYTNFLLDEFQDTSTIQWDCFRPLLANSIAEGCYNLIVGDVKQSIYRWRDADSSILGSQVSRELSPKGVVHEIPLIKNYRSTKSIVSFNNDLFKHISEKNSEQLDGIYKLDEVVQLVNDRYAVPGCVDVHFYDDGNQMPFVVQSVIDARERGFLCKDIAVIVRTHAIGENVADALSKAGIPVKTDDSLMVSNCNTVRKVVSALFRYDSPEDQINAYYAPEQIDYPSLSSARSIVEMVSLILSQLPEEQVSADTLYVLALLDLVRDFVSRNGNSLHQFLQFWKDKGISSKISSPKDSDAVTIITVHKCKGLDFPCTIIPVRASSKKSGKSWEYFDVKSTDGFEGCDDILFNIPLNSNVEDTLFSESCSVESTKKYIDEINVWYVAFTRATEEMTVISKSSGGRFVKDLYEFVTSNPARFVELEPIDSPELKRINDKGNDIICRHFRTGEKSRKVESKKKDDGKVLTFDLLYRTSTEKLRHNIRISRDSSEYFDNAGEMSRRKRGAILHRILESVDRPEDVCVSVESAVVAGLIRSSQAEVFQKILTDAIKKSEQYGWFSDNARSIRERDIILPSGEVYRPDRVVIKDDSVDIIDYKFGEPDGSYVKQVSRYAGLYRKMGYKRVNGYVWYVESGEVIEACLPQNDVLL